MPWTLWYNHQLVGQTHFEIQGRHAMQRVGIFHPDRHGISLVPAISYVHQALHDFEQMVKQRQLSHDEMLDSMGTTPEGMRVAECGEILEQLELRDDMGNTVACDAIAILDLAEFAESRPRSEARELARGAPRYMISTTIARFPSGHHLH